MKKTLYTLSTLAIAIALGVVTPASAETTVQANAEASTTIHTNGGSRNLINGLLNHRDERQSEKSDRELNSNGDSSASSTVHVRNGHGSSTRPELVSKEKTKGDKEIDRRVESLTKLSERVNEMNRVSDAEKVTLSAEIQAEIASLTNLKAKIDADTDANILKEDLKSVTGSYRVYALVMPQVTILAAADRVNVLAEKFTALSTKLQARITKAQNAGKDVSASVSALAELNAKVADAKVQAAAAISSTSTLTPDNGDKAKADANKAVLEAAKAKIKTANADLKVAKADAKKITKATKGFDAEVNASSTATTTSH